jgi:hypothetical protein
MLYLNSLTPKKGILGLKTGKNNQKAGKTDNFAASNG